MPSSFRTKSFGAFLLVIFINACVDMVHKVVVQQAVVSGVESGAQAWLVALVNGLILLPFLLLFSPAGFIADKFPKHKVMRGCAWASLALMLGVALSYWAGWFWLAFALIFLLGVQSAFFSPAKFGYIREAVGDVHLANANGAVQALTIGAMVSGILIATWLVNLLAPAVARADAGTLIQSATPVALGLVVLALVQLIATYWLEDKSRGLASDRPLSDIKTFAVSSFMQGDYLRKNLRLVTSRRAIILPIAGLTVFWAIAQSVLAIFPRYAEEVLLLDAPVTLQLILGATGIGAVLGALVAGRRSQDHLEMGLIPVGAVGFALTLGLMPAAGSLTSLGLLFALSGFLGGLFIVPLHTMIQYHARPVQLATMIAGSNFIQTLGIFALLGLSLLLSSAGMSARQLFLLFTLAALAGAIYTIYKLPHSLTRIITAFLFQGRYKVSVAGFENLPKSGAVLLLGNHISWIDWAVMQIASPRPLRFVMLRSIYEQWYLKPFLDFFGVIPISSGQSKEALAKINELLKAGEAVCLFPEGAISRTGSLGEFRSGFERVVDGVDGVIIPFYLHGLWGSRLSRARSEKLRKNTSQGLRREVVVTFGEALPLSTTATELKQKVFELSFLAWERQSQLFDPLPLAWIRAAKANLTINSAIDSTGTEFTNRRMLAAVVGFAKRMRAIDSSQNVAVLLPAGSAAAIANMAVMLNGQTAVNLNFTTSVAAVQHGIRESNTRTIYTSDRFLKKLQEKGLDTDAMLAGANLVFMEDLKEQLKKFDLIAGIIAAHLLPARWFYRVFGRPVDINAPAAVLFSSGSEGAPKGIVLSHRNFMANIKQISDVLKTRDDDIMMGSLPPFHSFGLTVTTLLPLVEGVPVVFHPDPTDVVQIAKTIARNNVTILCATATFLRLFSRNKKVLPLMLDPLRVVVAGAEKLSLDTRNEFLQRFNKVIYEGYGATETTPVASVNIPDQLDVDDWHVQIGSKIGTVGLPLPGCSFRIVDPATLESLATGEDGLILVSGTQVMLGYLNDPEKTREAIVELDGRRWYKTGDKGHLDADGFLTIVDRYSRFAKLGGEMVSLGAVEQALKKVIDAAMPEQPEDAPAAAYELLAVALPDEKKGERIVLLSTLAVDESALRQQALAANVNPMMLPGVIYQVEAIPKLGSGKTDFSAAKQLAQRLAQAPSDNAAPEA